MRNAADSCGSLPRQNWIQGSTSTSGWTPTPSISPMPGGAKWPIATSTRYRLLKSRTDEPPRNAPAVRVPTNLARCPYLIVPATRSLPLRVPSSMSTLGNCFK